MTEEEAKRCAVEFVKARDNAHQAKHGPPRYKRVIQKVVPNARETGQWAVFFGLETMEGSPVDSTAIVLVNDATGEVRFLD